MREWLEDALKPWPELESRSMFGGRCVYSEGTMFAILYEGRVYLKTDQTTREAFVQRGCEPFQPRKGSALASYHEVPGEILDDDAELLAWARRAALVARAPPSKPRAPRFHAEAGIAAEHCFAPSFGQTRWQEISDQYAMLGRIAPSPLHTLNRAVAVAEWQGPEAALAVLQGLVPPAWLVGSYLWDAVFGDLHRRAGNLRLAQRHRERALGSAPTPH